MADMYKFTLPALAGILLSGMALSAPAPDTVAEESAEETADLIVADTMDIKAYRDNVAGIESELGAYSSELPERLLSLGLALQAEGRHQEALSVFKRGTHVARISNGLYSATQIPMIRGEITSYIANGDLLMADERQHYMHKVQQRSLNSPESRTQAMMQQALWQHNAYKLGIGEQRYDRLLNMWDLYRGALTDIAKREGDNSIELLSPLNGLLQTQYLISGYQGEVSSGGFSSESNFSARQQQSRFNAYRAKSYKQGSAVIRAIYDVEKAQPGGQLLAAAEALVMLGDWMLWHGAKEPAAQAYQEALGELSELEDAEDQIERLFGEPVPLPAIEGVQPLPPVVAAQEGDILVEFDVTEVGRVTDLTRLDENTENKGSANRLMRKLRGTRFRPRFENMTPVSTENINNAYKIAK